MFINNLLVFILELFPALQLCKILNLLGGGSRPFQLFKYALDVVPFFHLPRRLAEWVGHDLPNADNPLLDFVLALLTSGGATLGVLHQEPLLRHVWLVGETLTKVELLRNGLEGSSFWRNQKERCRWSRKF